MKRLPSNSEDAPLSGPMRHYHRAGSPKVSTWDEWIDGKTRKAKRSVKWFRTVVIILAVVALGGICAGLFIVLQ